MLELVQLLAIMTVLKKVKQKLEHNVFIGSNSSLVAPITLE